jgi:hypothetical protein
MEGKDTMTTFLENLPLAKEKLLDMNNGDLPMAA